MVVCHYFLQGKCRYGENCKFEHPYNDQQQHSSIIRHQNFKSNNNNATGAPVDTPTLVRSVTNDMMSVEKGGQWLLSCYAPFKEKSLFPGFTDHSFEEIRFGYYNAKNSGTVDAYIQQLNMLLQEATMRIKALQNPSQEAIMIMRTIFDENVQSSNVVSNSSASVFGNNQKNILSNTATNTNNFMQPSNMGNTNIFSTNTQTPQQNSSAQSIFAAANQSLFSGSQPPAFGNTNQNMFGNLQQSNSPLGQPFGNDNAFTSGSLFNTPFSSNSNPTQFVSTVPTNTFVTQQPPAGASVFKISTNNSNSPLMMQQNTNTTFNAPVSQNTLFNNSNSSFGNTQQPLATSSLPNPENASNNSNSPLVAGQLNTNTTFNAPVSTLFNSLNSSFGKTQQSLPTSSLPNPENVFNSNISKNTFNVHPLGAVDESIYSKLEDLSESDIKSYQADAFEFGKIPEKPPHISMC